MSSKIQVQIVIAVAVGVWAVLLLAEGVPLNGSYLRPYSVVVFVVATVFVVFDRWLWRFPGISRLVHRPVLCGTWKATLNSSWNPSTTPEDSGPIVAFFAIRQSYSGISLRMMTKESISRSVTATLETGIDGVPRIMSIYENTPGVHVQDRSRIHHGAMLLDVHGSPVDQITGWYWTDRDTKGQVTLEKRVPKLSTSYDEAVATFEQ